MPNLIYLTKGFVTVVDEEDYDRLNRYRWYASGADHRPARRAPEHDRKIILIYHQILNVLPWVLRTNGLCVDHIDRDCLNNRKENIRVVTQQENMLNSITSINKVGVSIDRTWNTFKAYYDNPFKKRINIGTYKTREEAEAALMKFKAEHRFD